MGRFENVLGSGSYSCLPRTMRHALHSVYHAFLLTLLTSKSNGLEVRIEPSGQMCTEGLFVTVVLSLLPLFLACA